MRKPSKKTSRSSTDWAVECQKEMEHWGPKIHRHAVQVAKNTCHARAACWHVVKAHIEWLRNAQPEYLQFVKKHNTTIDDYLDSWMLPLLSEMNRSDIVAAIQKGISLNEFVNEGAAPYLATVLRNRKRTPDPVVPSAPKDNADLTSEERIKRFKDVIAAKDAVIAKLRAEIRELRQVLARVEAESKRIRNLVKGTAK